MKLGFIFSALLVSSAAMAATPKTVLKFAETDGQLEFHATTHPVGVNIHGTGPIPSGTLILDHGNLTGDLTVDLTKFDAGMSLRTTHMKEKAFQVDQYPQAKLAVTDLKLINGADSVPFHGNLTFHGVTKPVDGTAKISRHEESLDVHADFKLKMSDYAIAIKPFAGVSVDDEVAVNVDGKAELVTEKSSDKPVEKTAATHP